MIKRDASVDRFGFEVCDEVEMERTRGGELEEMEAI